MNKITRCCLHAFVLASMVFMSAPILSASHHETPIVEVRVYKIKPGKMDEWERFFHEHLVKPQEDAGMKIVGAYRSLDDENTFVWMRQFTSESGREKARKAFYESDHWKNTLRPQLQEMFDKVETVYNVLPSK